MFDSLLREAATSGQSKIREAGDRRIEARVRELEAELHRTREELEVLRGRTAEVVTAILDKMHRSTPVAEVAVSIRELADLHGPGPGEVVSDPITGEVGIIDVSNRASLSVLDRRFRWLPSRHPAPARPAD